MMSGSLQIEVYDGPQLVYRGDLPGPVELGRQSDKGETLYSHRADSGRWRVAIARLDEDTTSRKHLLLEPLDAGRVRLTNLSSKLPLVLDDGREVAPLAGCECDRPFALAIDHRTIRVQPSAGRDHPFQTLGDVMMVPGHVDVTLARLPSLTMPPGSGADMEAMLRWMQATMSVLQSAANSSDFFQKAAEAAVEIVGLDSGRVLLWDHEAWQTEAVKTTTRFAGTTIWPPSQQILDRVREEKRTLFEEPAELVPTTGSLRGVKVVVAAPILDREGQVIGVLYGDRRQENPANLPRITKVEAMLVELLASGVAAGLARLEQEKAALAARIQFEQFFTPELASVLSSQPDLLAGRDCEVTLLFCDIRNFTRISDRLGPARMVEWIRDVMEALSECVLAHKGAVVDYVGDEMLAMWGAPQEQAEHPQLACSAGLAMIEQLAPLNRRWQSVLGQPLSLGIGVNTGTARVGNTGTQRKFKYGPLGKAVSLAKRVQGVTKYLRTTLLITGSTYDRLTPNFLSRRVCTAELSGIAEPVELYELVTPGRLNWMSLKFGYEKALAEYDQQNFRRAASILGNLLTQFPDDGPSLSLMSRAVHALVDEVQQFSPVWKLQGR